MYIVVRDYLNSYPQRIRKSWIFDKLFEIPLRIAITFRDFSKLNIPRVANFSDSLLSSGDFFLPLERQTGRVALTSRVPRGSLAPKNGNPMKFNAIQWRKFTAKVPAYSRVYELRRFVARIEDLSSIVADSVHTRRFIDPFQGQKNPRQLCRDLWNFSNWERICLFFLENLNKDDVSSLFSSEEYRLSFSWRWHATINNIKW